MAKKKRVIVFGIFDGMHEGHRDFFRQAKEQGDDLIVIVGRDSACMRWKGRKPYHSEEERVSLVLKERYVDDAILGDEEQSTYSLLKNLNPDVICVGYDQDGLLADLQKWIAKKKKSIQIIRLVSYHPQTYHNSKLHI